MCTKYSITLVNSVVEWKFVHCVNRNLTLQRDMIKLKLNHVLYCFDSDTNTNVNVLLIVCLASFDDRKNYCYSIGNFCDWISIKVMLFILTKSYITRSLMALAKIYDDDSLHFNLFVCAQALSILCTISSHRNEYKFHKSRDSFFNHINCEYDYYFHLNWIEIESLLLLLLYTYFEYWNAIFSTVIVIIIIPLSLLLFMATKIIPRMDINAI